MSSRVNIVASASFNNINLHLYQVFNLKVLNIPADAIVNSTNKNLDYEGGIAEAIARNAGEEIRHESILWVKENGRVVHGGVASTDSGNLKNKGFKCVITLQDQKVESVMKK